MQPFPYKIGDRVWIEEENKIALIVAYSYGDKVWQAKLDFRDGAVKQWYFLESIKEPTIMQLFLYG